ncbi:hypothetical protein F6B42_00120 [Microbacterium radiodurans]|uniref:Uncharacterized protein n=2 Tax=Microbacterium radiodurans TaxID=661398 RepID=A0A5J5IXT5_9MICO|nr:hypothetical protein F6B42_00120 [Microbacterium radiodurans]
MRRWAAAAVTGAIAVALVGCGPAPWNAPGETPDAAPTTPRTTAPPPVPNDLSGGSTERQVTAGAVAASLNYWSDLSMDRWTATALKPVSLSLATTVTPDDGQRVYLQKATMIAVPGNAQGDLGPLAPTSDQSATNPGYLVLSPYSYSQTFYVEEVPAEATFVTLRFTYDFLVQTTPTSNEYAKQTGTDSLTVAIAPSGE